MIYKHLFLKEYVMKLKWQHKQTHSHKSTDQWSLVSESRRWGEEVWLELCGTVPDADPDLETSLLNQLKRDSYQLDLHIKKYNISL